MPVKQRVPKARQPGALHPVFRRYFLDEITAREGIELLRSLAGSEYSEAAWVFQQMFWPALGATKSEAEVWAEHRDELLAEFIEKHPGRRPAAWWTYDAPMAAEEIVRRGWDRAWFADGLRDPRRQVGGVGVAMHDQYPAVVPYFDKGIPRDWFIWDDDDPPSFEAQAMYLQRHALFLPGEEQRLSAADFENEVILIED